MAITDSLQRRSQSDAHTSITNGNVVVNSNADWNESTLPAAFRPRRQTTPEISGAGSQPKPGAEWVPGPGTSSNATNPSSDVSEEDMIQLALEMSLDEEKNRSSPDPTEDNDLNVDIELAIALSLKDKDISDHDSTMSRTRSSASIARSHQDFNDSGILEVDEADLTEVEISGPRRVIRRISMDNRPKEDLNRPKTDRYDPDPDLDMEPDEPDICEVVISGPGGQRERRRSGDHATDHVSLDEARAVAKALRNRN
uniref:Uncharacterized protein n=1 Tax=Attheya septentrionalis TaxID=420275 RepID=A0A7S2UL58_9STRA|mmetsp:Transcript_26978/g.49068  ORF Transcript_26978/g.49068 Transcript_26978/m.49068 type:complete len:255 (+) Transcript_26978:93-857(+)|eukprot:CAMPEP_0198282844 /NCGR_PEP_ID=MMETSP1449-20131203/2591_1 /TAXON_ID=420275 /ORGANISM="Attheya septentrionalis, Strain CCMP2084" /LENGTH=254 /DNA_ID=CAMNT_0043979259 /DNA_START=52 /DNA_END=816 /DNA_ORIENTATION=-